MQAISDVATSTPAVSEEDAHRAAHDYVATHIHPAFEMLSGLYLYSKEIGREVWRFVVCCADCADGFLDAVEVDAQTGVVIQFSDDRIRLIHERAIIYAAEQRGVLPVNAQGYVIGEYARRQANRYLGDAIAPFFNAIEPVFIPHYLPRWRVKVVFRLHPGDPFILGVMNVNAKTGEPIPLTQQQLNHIHERVHVFVTSDAQPVAA